MSHSSGIAVSENLLSTFADASRGGTAVRLIQVQIVNETSLDLVKTVDAVHDWEKDFDLVSPILSDKEAAFVLLRTDEKNETTGSSLWYILCYVPDKCKVRDKMMYASSRANLKSGLGSNNFVDEIFGTTPNEFSSAGFASWQKHQAAASPLTELEIQKNEELEAGLFKGGGGTSSAYVHGVAFPVNEDLLHVLESFASGSINYVQVGIDPTNERIILSQSATLDISEIPAQMPTNEPRFHFYRWQHQHEGAEFNTIVYCYSCPSSPVKLRMLYSSSKANVASVAESKGINVDLKLEITNSTEWSVEEISQMAHPAKAEQKQGFAKPKPPGGKGRRLITENKQ